MTRKEVIEVLKDIYNYTRFDTYTTNEARTMARQKWCIVQLTKNLCLLQR